MDSNKQMMLFLGFLCKFFFAFLSNFRYDARYTVLDLLVVIVDAARAIALFHHRLKNKI